MPQQTQPPAIIVFDIDGTLADCDHRRKFVVKDHPDNPRPGKKDFKAFYAAMGEDPCIRHMLMLHNMFYMHGWQIVYCTGRPDTYADITLNWLREHGFLGVDDAIMLMRPEDQLFIPDYEVKQQMFDQLTGEMGFRIHMVFDDRQQVVDMWRRNGVPCMQVADGNF